MASDIADLQKRIRKFVDERDWDQFHNPKDLAISLSLEAGEVLEHFQWKSYGEIVTYLENNKDAVGEELVDVLWYMILLANKTNIDLSRAFEKKLDKNDKKYPIEKARGNHKKYTEHIA